MSKKNRPMMEPRTHKEVREQPPKQDKLKPKPVTDQECRQDAEFPAAFLTATAAQFSTRENGPGENGWKASMAMGEMCAVEFVRRLRELRAPF